VRTIALVAALLMAGPALGQTANSSSSAGSSSQAGSQAGSSSGAAVYQNTNATTADSIKTVPAVVAPGLYAGTNPCAVGASAGGSVLGFGLAVGGQWTDKGCERRNQAVILKQFGHHEAAKELLCDDPDIAAAFNRVAQPCVARVAAKPGEPAPAPMPAPPPRPMASAFDPGAFAKQSDCLTAASMAGQPLGRCSGVKP
jgi:hypothetical protein